MNNKFSFDIGKVIQNTDVNTKANIENDSLNHILNVGNEIVDVFSKHKMDLEDAYLVLVSLADAIYLYSQVGDE